MQGKKFKYYLRNKVGYYYYVDNLRTVQLSAAPVELVNTPEGWQKQICGIVRSDEYKGLFTKFTSPLEFVGDGKLILDSVAIAEGPSATVELYIRIQKSVDFSYEDFFEGSHDLLNFKSKDFTTTANVNENRALAVLEAKKNVTVEIPLTDANSVQVQLDGTVLFSKKTFSGIPDAVGISVANAGNLSKTRYFYLTYIHAQAEGTNSNLAGNDITIDINGFAGIDYSTSDQHFLKAYARTNLTITYKRDIKYRSLAPVSGHGAIYFISSKGGAPGQIIHTVWSNFHGTPPPLDIQTVSGTFNYTMELGEKLFYVLELNIAKGTFDPGSYPVFFSTTENVDSYSYNNRYRPTLHRAIFPGKVWRELVNKVTNGAYPGTSQFLDGDTSKLLIPASCLRGDGKNILKTTVEQFLKYAYCIHLGVLSEGSTVAEIKSYKDCFIPTDSMDVGEVSAFEWGFAKELMVGKVKGGYERQDLGQDTANGRYDFHAPVEWTTGQDAVQETYDFVCPYIGSMYAFEVMRVNYATKSTTDNPNDNSVFILDAVKGVDKLYYSGRIEAVAGNAFQLDGTLGALANGSTFKVSESAGYDGTYTVTGTTYPSSGGTLVAVAQTLTLGVDSGWLKIFDPNLYGPNRPAYPSLTGLLDAASAFNVNISPAHLLRLHGPFIYGGIYNPTATPQMGYLQFRSGEKNTDLSVTMPDGRTIAINQNVPLPDLGQPVYLPVEYSFNAKYREDVFQVLKTGSNRYRQVSFLRNGHRFKAFIKEVDSNPDNNEPQTWVLIAAAGSNLQNLLQYE